jgi:hypothetical protein
MNVQLSPEASQCLEVLRFIPQKSRTAGFVLGHKRGRTFFVEKIFPLEEAFSLPLENFYSLTQVFEGKLIGFFSLNSGQKKIQRILKPLAYGKLFLDVRLDTRKRLSLKPYIIDYDREFYLSPLRLTSPKQVQK